MPLGALSPWIHQGPHVARQDQDRATRASHLLHSTASPIPVRPAPQDELWGNSTFTCLRGGEAQPCPHPCALLAAKPAAVLWHAMPCRYTMPHCLNPFPIHRPISTSPELAQASPPYSDGSRLGSSHSGLRPGGEGLGRGSPLRWDAAGASGTGDQPAERGKSRGVRAGADFPEGGSKEPVWRNHSNEASREVTDSRRPRQRGWRQQLAEVAAGRAAQLHWYQGRFGEPSLPHRRSLLSDALMADARHQQFHSRDNDVALALGTGLGKGLVQGWLLASHHYNNILPEPPAESSASSDLLHPAALGV